MCTHQSRTASSLLYSLLVKDNMPQVLKHTSTVRVGQLCIQQPLSKANIVVPRPRQDGLSRQAELSTARHPNFRNSLHQAVSRGRTCKSRLPPIILVNARSKRSRRRARIRKHIVPDLRRHGKISSCLAAIVNTARIRVAAEVNVAIFYDVGELQGANGDDLVVERGVGVPGCFKAVAVGVEEEEDAGEVGVVVDYMGEVGHGFVAFVLGDDEGVIRGPVCVDIVEGSLPASVG